MMNAKVLVLAALIAAGVIAAVNGLVGISLEGMETADFGKEFLALIFAALVIERAVEVFVDTEFSGRTNRVKRPVRIARLAMDRAKEARDAAIASPLPAGATDGDRATKAETVEIEKAEFKAATQAYEEALATNAPNIEQLADEKKTFASRVSLFLALGAAVIGIRVFSMFLPVDPVTGVVTGAIAANKMQMMLFTTFDVVVTALLLAGGAKGIHNLIGDFLSKRNALDALP